MQLILLKMLEKQQLTVFPIQLKLLQLDDLLEEKRIKMKKDR